MMFLSVVEIARSRPLAGDEFDPWFTAV